MPRVVVIDDEEMVAELTAAVLSASGFDVVVAHSGKAALQLIREVIPDAVICDVRMPEMSGEEVFLRLRLDPKTHHVPVVFMSGQCNAKSLALGDAFVEKPYNCKELIAIVKRLTTKDSLIKS
jgi:two-component system, sensor histidine kinase and response regulator